MPNGAGTVATPDLHIQLDTQAFGRPRRRRTTLRATYWLLLVAAAAAVAAILSVAAAKTHRGTDAAGADGGRTTGTAKAMTAVRKARRPAIAAVPVGLVAAGTAPPPARTPVAIWNGFGGKGAASGMAAELKRLGYPVRSVGNAPTSGYRRTLVLYTRGQAPAAVALARRLRLPRAAVGPLDGGRPAAIRPARLLVILGG